MGNGEFGNVVKSIYLLLSIINMYIDIRGYRTNFLSRLYANKFYERRALNNWCSHEKD